MTNILAYFAGVLLHVATKWGASATKGQKNYLAAYWRVNLFGALATIPAFAFWESGVLPEILRLIGQGLVNGTAAIAGEAAIQVPPPSGGWAAFAAGFVMDSVARTLFLAYESRLGPKEEVKP